MVQGSTVRICGFVCTSNCHRGHRGHYALSCGPRDEEMVALGVPEAPSVGGCAYTSHGAVVSSIGCSRSSTSCTVGSGGDDNSVRLDSVGSTRKSAGGPPSSTGCNVGSDGDDNSVRLEAVGAYANQLADLRAQLTAALDRIATPTADAEREEEETNTEVDWLEESLRFIGPYLKSNLNLYIWPNIN